MSLLMDALRKAEDAKRQADDRAPQGAAEASELTLAPFDPAPPANASTGAAARLPDLAEHNATLDAELSAMAGPTPLPRRNAAVAPGTAAPDAASGQAAARAAARNVFAAKTRQRSPRSLWLLVAALGGLAALGIGAYFWWQLQAVSGGINAARQPAAASAPAALAFAPTAPAVAAITPIAAADLAAETAASPPPDAPEPTAAPVVRTATASATPGARREPPAPASLRAATASPARPPTARGLSGGSPGGADRALQLSSGRAAAAAPVERAFDALQGGRLDEAQQGYQQVLRSEPKNTDAWLGLATIAARRGQAEQAQAYYLRALEADPSNPTAQAGLLNSRGQSDPALAESRLKSALDAQPDSAALLSALGNLYARQARWNEAQQAYFRAYAAAPDNPDIIFNLAVSLDHLRQNKLAAQYYQMALTAAQDHHAQPALFDSQQVARRVQELQP